MQPHKKEDIHNLTILLCKLDDVITEYHDTDFEDGQITYHRNRAGLELMRRLYCGMGIIINKGGFLKEDLKMIRKEHPEMYKVYKEEMEEKANPPKITARPPTEFV